MFCLSRSEDQDSWGCWGCLTELVVRHELCSPAGITLSIGLGTTPASGRGDQAARAGPGDAACGEQTPSPGQESWAGQPGGAGRGCQVKPDTAGPRHGVDRILTRPGGLPPPLWGDCHWCRLTQHTAAPGALQALEFPEWAKELIFTWDSFITLLPSPHPATEQNITISSCSELDGKTFQDPPGTQPPLAPY